MGLCSQKWPSRTEPGRGDKDASGQGAPIAAMERLQASVDCSVIALWLGHESIKTTQVYPDAHLALKEAALAKVKPFNGQKGGATSPVTACSPSSTLYRPAFWRRSSSHSRDVESTIVRSVRTADPMARRSSALIT